MLEEEAAASGVRGSVRVAVRYEATTGNRWPTQVESRESPVPILQS
jgi:hypothetical protein